MMTPTLSKLTLSQKRESKQLLSLEQRQLKFFGQSGVTIHDVDQPKPLMKLRSSRKLSSRKKSQRSQKSVKTVFKAVKKRGRPKVIKTAEEKKAAEDKKIVDMKQKGRKRERWEKYKAESEAKIQELRDMLKEGQDISNSERIRIRNKISAR